MRRAQRKTNILTTKLTAEFAEAATKNWFTAKYAKAAKETNILTTKEHEEKHKGTKERQENSSQPDKVETFVVLFALGFDP